jgi:DNA-binding NarL/FixJ family response regulator
MKIIQVVPPIIHIAMIDSDSLRFLGLHALLSSESDLDLQSVSMAEITTRQEVDLVLVGNRSGRNVLEVLTTMKALCPGLDVIVMGNLDDASILKAVSAGAKGYVDEAASVGELVQAIRIVVAGSVWVPRRVLAMFVEQVYRSPDQGVFPGQRPFTSREREVLRMLVAGCSNREIASPLGITERTVKSYIGKLMRKVGVVNRVRLSVHAITHSLVLSRQR